MGNKNLKAKILTNVEHIRDCEGRYLIDCYLESLEKIAFEVEQQAQKLKELEDKLHTMTNTKADEIINLFNDSSIDTEYEPPHPIFGMAEHIDWLNAKCRELEQSQSQIAAEAIEQAHLPDSNKVLVDRELIEAVAHIGVDFGYGKYELQPEHIEKARLLLSTQEDKKPLNEPNN